MAHAHTIAAYLLPFLLINDFLLIHMIKSLYYALNYSSIFYPFLVHDIQKAPTKMWMLFVFKFINVVLLEHLSETTVLPYNTALFPLT